MTSHITRLIFYGGIMLASALAFKFSGGEVSLTMAQAVLLPLAGLSGTIQSINFFVIKKIEEVETAADLGYYANWRLVTKLDDRRALALYRAVVGITAALLTAVSVGLLRVFENESEKLLTLGASVGSAVISLLMLFLTVYEFHALSNLQAELRRKNAAKEKKAEALKLLRAGESDS